MAAWVRFPTIYEINTWVWLSELGKRTGASVNLSSVPSTEWDAIASMGFDAVWLLGASVNLSSCLGTQPCWNCHRQPECESAGGFPTSAT